MQILQAGPQDLLKEPQINVSLLPPDAISPQISGNALTFQGPPGEDRILWMCVRVCMNVWCRVVWSIGKTWFKDCFSSPQFHSFLTQYHHSSWDHIRPPTTEPKLLSLRHWDLSLLPLGRRLKQVGREMSQAETLIRLHKVQSNFIFRIKNVNNYITTKKTETKQKPL